MFAEVDLLGWVLQDGQELIVCSADTDAQGKFAFAPVVYTMRFL